MNITAYTKKYSELICRALNGKDILISSEFDLSADGNSSYGIFAISDERICIIEKENIVLVENISALKKVTCAEYTGCGALESFSSKGRNLLVRFSMKYIDSFNAISEVINEIINGNIPVIENKTSTSGKVCSKCGKPYIGNTERCQFCTSKVGVIKRLWQLSKPCRPLYAILLLLFWISSAITILSPFLSKNLINNVLTNPAKADNKYLFGIVGLLLLCTIITWIVTVFKNIVSSKASNLLVLDLRNFIFEKLHRMPLKYLEKKKTGDLIQRINNDTQRIQLFIQDIAIVSVNEIILFLSIALITFSLNYKMALLIFVPMPLSLFLIMKIRKSIRSRYMIQWRKMDVLTNRLTEVINSIKLVKVLGKENEESERFQDTAKVVRDITCKNEKYVYTIFPLIRFLMSFGSFLVLFWGGSEVLNSNMSLGELVQFSSYGSYLYSKLEWFSMLPRHFTMALVSSQRIFEILDEVEVSQENDCLHIEDVKNSIELKNVSFGYKTYKKVLRNLNSHIKKGEMIGLVGHSGAGKSTFINLIMRLYSPDSGQILLDGNQLMDYFEKDYKDILGVVLQESYLFSGTILDNIAYSKPDATLEECIIAAKRANAHDFIMGLPDAYNTYIGEKGHKLSGGERQRISIARAILSNSSILILDEATSSVDTETEVKIQDALKNLMDGKTVFAIAHRLSTLKNADRLFVFEEGRIVEEGTHIELVKKNGIYAKLLKAQQEMSMRTSTIDNIESDTVEGENKGVEGEDIEYGKD